MEPHSYLGDILGLNLTVCDFMNSTEIFDNFLVFVVGKSGSGKDTLMRESSRILFSQNIPIKIFRRHITRLSDENEESHFISNSDFLKLQEKGEFVLSWEIYGNYYGINQLCLEHYLQKKIIVLVNVSRSILFEARKFYPNSKIILVEVPSELARKRVQSRGRDTGEYLETRLQRMQQQISMPHPDLILQNTGNINIVINEFSKYLIKLYHGKSSSK